MSGVKPKWGGAPAEKCTKCGKTVYAAEMTKMENQIWHIECLRCVECNKKLAGSNWGGFVPPDNQPYCNVHHKRLLQSAGSAIEFSGSTTSSQWAIRVAAEGAQGSVAPGSAPPAEKKAVPADQACTKCGGRAYPAESVKMEGQLWHDNCLRCVETGCGKKLNGSNWGGFVAPNNSPYCSVHLKRLVQSAGNSLETTGSTTGSKWNQGTSSSGGSSISSSQGGGGSSISGSQGGGGSSISSSQEGSDSSALESSGNNENEGGEGEERTESAPSSGNSSAAASSPAAASPSSAEPRKSGAPSRWGGAPSEKCVKCGKTVYSAEMAKMENQIWHDNCLRCVEEGCNKKLSGSNWGGFVPPNNQPYCKVHHQRLLQSSGSSIAFSGSTTASKWNIKTGQ